MMKRLVLLLFSFLMILIPLNVIAAPFEYIRIGDKDGFGYGDGSTTSEEVATTGGFYEAANGGSVNTDGVGLLYGGDFLPDLNGGGGVLTGGDDDFDNRDGDEASDNKFSAVGASLGSGMDGSDFTDIALSTSYDASSDDDEIWNHDTGTYGAGGDFPEPPSDETPNQPGFVFDFLVSAEDILEGTDVYFNMLFGDYDVGDATINITTWSGDTTNLSVTKQNMATEDGLIQTAYSIISFYDVFYDTNIDGDWLGYLEIDFVANTEPYTAFDFVELSVDPISPNQPVPEPTTMLLLGSGLVGLAGFRRKWATKGRG